jgi:hypothetical protein
VRADVKLTSSRIIDAEPAALPRTAAEKYAELRNRTTLQYVERGESLKFPPRVVEGGVAMK